MSAIDDLKKAVIDGDDDGAREYAAACIAAGVPAMDAVNVMGDALRELGVQFQNMEVFLPEVLLATDAFKAGLAVLEPELMKAVDGAAPAKKIKAVIATVKGDVHAVGKDMVATMWTVAGFDVKNLGADVDSEYIVKAAEEFGADIIGLSALMSTTIPHQKEVIDFLEAKGLRSKYKVLVGGGSTTPQWAEQIGSDGFSKDAVEAVELAKKVMGV
ncbi:cobalamin B12-binding domain-containing protein [Mailhella sp.]|jgi:trimethylamine corrinoid protein|uniref:cobalamin B12-binding domain-containing protein n=1 Tax=Mailhella sp. TaxID=1981029 RepID=UPI0040640ABF